MLNVEIQNEFEVKYAFSGDLSVSKSQDIYSEIKKADLSILSFQFKVKDVENLDLSFFQLLYAFAKKLKFLEKKISFEFYFDDEYQRVFQRSGLQDAFDKLLKM